MGAEKQSDPGTSVERQSDRELVVTRTFDAPASLVFKAWSTPELFIRWWAPASFGMSILSFKADIRIGGSYRLTMRHPTSDQPMEFFGKYLDVTPPSRIVWTNEENGEAGAVTTATFTESGGRTKVVLRDLYPSREALDAAMASGATSGFDEQFRQLDTLLAGEAS